MFSQLRGNSNVEEKLPRYENSTPAELRNRTEKGRTHFLLNKQKARLAAEQPRPANEESKCAQLQKFFFTSKFFKAQLEEGVYASDGVSDYKSFGLDRARSVYSLARCLAEVISKFFTAENPETRLFHAINTHVVDDTSTRLKGPTHADRATVFTIMNTVQCLHARYTPINVLAAQGNTGKVEEADGCKSLRVPTPLQLVTNADATGIHRGFADSAVLTAQGMGRMLQRFGAPKDPTPQAAWKTFVFAGDALKANEAAFRAECLELFQSNKEKQLAIRFRCAIHQICLIRKPVVLSVPKLWSTVVRLSHLFETMSFRKSLARALTNYVSKNFVYLQVTKLPEESCQWQKTHQRLRASVQCSSKLLKKTFHACLDFLNGDLSSDCVFHYCIQKQDGKPCCNGYADSLMKCLKLIIPSLSRGYPVPLLYRFKHYDEAISYIVFGTTLHGLLAKALGAMDFGKDAACKDQQSDLVDKLLADGEIDFDSQKGAEGRFIDDLFPDNGDGFRAYNAKRRELVQQEIMQEKFLEGSQIITFMIQPMDHRINKLFARSAELTKLALFGSEDESWREITAQSKDLFLSMVSGGFGWSIIEEYIEMTTHRLGCLAATGVNLKSSGTLQTIFSMMILIVSDTWKRFVHDYSACPYKIFELSSVDLKTFVKKWDSFHEEMAFCSACFDDAFSKKLLCGFPSQLATQPEELQKSVQCQVQLLLHDLATHSPVSSDAVEIKNGNVQHIASHRGNMVVKTPVAAKESSFLQSAIRDFELARHWVEERTLPGKATVSGILRMHGASGGSNQYSTGDRSRPVTFTWFWFAFLCLFFWSLRGGL